MSELVTVTVSEVVSETSSLLVDSSVLVDVTVEVTVDVESTSE